MTGGMLDSCSILRALRRRKAGENFRDEWTAFWSTRFGRASSRLLWSILIFALAALVLDLTGVLPIAGGRN